MFGVYLHIPFCKKRCPFCDFTLTTGASEAYRSSYVDALCQEIHQSTLSEEETLTSIYFGGGTPSLLSSPQIEKILSCIQKKTKISDECEITIEANPEDIDLTLAKNWHSNGITRISLGAQAMDDPSLRSLGREHTRYQIEHAVQTLYSSNIQNISVDLLFGIQGQSMDDWILGLTRAIALDPKHISTYNLTIEENTEFKKKSDLGLLQLPSDDLQSEMMLQSKLLLEENQFDPYEISNACKKGFESRHNLLYWTDQPYLGFGVSAHSYLPIKSLRWSNTKNIPEYIRLCRDQKSPIRTTESIDEHTHIVEILMTGLRLKAGLDLLSFSKKGLRLSPETLERISTLVGSGRLRQEESILKIHPTDIPLTSEIILYLIH